MPSRNCGYYTAKYDFANKTHNIFLVQHLNLLKNMTVAEAKSLLATCSFTEQETWTDLGCGNGIFAYALAELLAKGSSIYAIDKQKQHLSQTHNQISILFNQANFSDETLNIKPLNGILMANSLHFIANPEKLINRLENYFASDNKKWIIIEYDHFLASQWEPYPMPFDKLKTLFKQLGYTTTRKIAERKSVFGGKMYAAFFCK
ncbi:class I SAM-dependent methyltransferase [Pedobacter sp. SL55]|uniref:class I SAM-dependent methyltransferase n=1 Tax=Pedobacter sp. SL55 TaxID=2995161 RepID=UPI00226DCF7E|nr:methyltransferase domain-containing protein [Pedobacter sp. SL55]WAC39721.1 methyltransferase domain-containing protein [Pedobacter sp. SL55]